MSPQNRKQHCVAWLAVLILALASAAGAGELAVGEGAFSLHLEETLAPVELGPEPATSEAAETGAVDSSPLATLHVAALAVEVGATVAIEAQEGQAAPQRKGFGRWLKKHWYVPVLIGAAIGVSVSDSGDDDRSGEDD